MVPPSELPLVQFKVAIPEEIATETDVGLSGVVTAGTTAVAVLAELAPTAFVA